MVIIDNCTQSEPVSTILWSTTGYTMANNLASTDADDIQGFSGVDLKINNACTPV